MQLSMNVVGIDEIARRWALAPKQIDAAARIAIHRGITTMRARARAHAATLGRPPYDARLQNSVQLRTITTGLVGEVFSQAATAASIERGRAPGEHVKVGLILGWINRSGIVAPAAAVAGARQSVKTHAVVNRKTKGVATAQRHLAWKIAMAIGQLGTKPLPFLTPVAGESRVDIQRYFQEAIADALKKIAGK